MENNKNKKYVKFQGDMLNFCDFIQVFVFTTNHHLNLVSKINRPVTTTQSILGHLQLSVHRVHQSFYLKLETDGPADDRIYFITQSTEECNIEKRTNE